MKLKDFLRDRLALLTVNGCAFFFLAAVMLVLNVCFLVIFVTFFIWFAPLVSALALQFCREKRYLDQLTALSQNLDQAYLLSEVVQQPDYLEGKLYHQALRRANKSMLERVSAYQAAQREYREYVETWVHKIKTPIASAQLIIDNHKDPVTRQIGAELRRIDGYVEQALYYAKSSAANQDYQIHRCGLSQLVRDAITRNAPDLIRQGFSVDVSQAEGTVYSDPKWVGFILNQLISNALKYCREDGRTLTISAEESEHQTVLSVRDSGIGIPLQDQGRVFEKGFTGENGRRFGKSTGMGLYLCKKLCGSLGIGLSLTSVPGEGTTFRLTFPAGDLNTVARGHR